MSNSAFLSIRPALTFRPMSPFLAMLIESACKRLERPEEMAPTSVVTPRTIAPAESGRLDVTV